MCGKGRPRIEGQGRKNREHFVGEKCIELRALIEAELAQLQHADVAILERGEQFLAQEFVSRVDQAADRGVDGIQRFHRAASVETRFLDAVLDLLQQARHTHHEELVDVGAEDRQKLDALEQRVATVASLFEHAPLELQVAELAIEIKGGVVKFGEVCDLERRSGGFRTHVLSSVQKSGRRSKVKTFLYENGRRSN